MAWTTISDATLEVGKALRALTMRNLRDNITALANGDAGAPQVQTAAIAAGVVTNAKMAAGSIATGNIIDGNVTSGKLAAGTNEVNWVLARTAGGSTGAVGAYAFLTNSTGSAHSEGGNYAGSLFYSATTGSAGGAAGGTWKCMGNAPTGSRTVYLRIA